MWFRSIPEKWPLPGLRPHGCLHALCLFAALSLAGPAALHAQRAVLDTLELKNLELWVTGERLQGPTAIVEWDGESLWFNGVRARIKTEPKPLSDSSMIRVYGHTPRARELMFGGMSQLEAAKQYRRENADLYEAMRHAMWIGGPDSATAVAKRSPLVREVFGVRDSVISLNFWGLGGEALGLNRRMSPPNPEKQARGIVAILKSCHGLVFVSLGNVWGPLRGQDDVDRAKRQVDYVLAGGDLKKGLPEGPFPANYGPLADIQKAHHRGGKRR